MQPKLVEHERACFLKRGAVHEWKFLMTMLPNLSTNLNVEIIASLLLLLRHPMMINCPRLRCIVDKRVLAT